jgi:hypothetical protein
VIPSSADVLNVLGLDGTSVLPVKTKEKTEKTEGV